MPEGNSRSALERIDDTRFIWGAHSELDTLTDAQCQAICEFVSRGGNLLIFDLPGGSLRVLWNCGPIWVN